MLPFLDWLPVRRVLLTVVINFFLLGTVAAPANAQVLEGDELDTLPQPVKRPRPTYPFDKRRDGIMGGAIIEFIVTGKGGVVEARPVAETDPAFGEAATKSVAQWKFKPGIKDGKPASARMVVPIFFLLEASGDEVTQKIDAAITGFPPQSPPQVPSEFQYDKAPVPQQYQPPVWPWVEGKPVREGTADVFYGIDSSGRVVQVRVVSATSDAFGKAAQAAVECWRFKPAELKGNPVPALGRREVQFKQYLPADAPELRQLKAIEKGTAEYASANDLDAKLKPLTHVPPQYPLALAKAGPAGLAVIECIIDRGGRVVLPRIIEATQEEFGWAAATAVSRWRFAPPTVKGKPVDVKVRIPFEFNGRNNATD